MMAGAGASPYELASDAASRLGIAVGAEELAALASDLDLGDGEMAAVAATSPTLRRGGGSPPSRRC